MRGPFSFKYSGRPPGSGRNGALSAVSFRHHSAISTKHSHRIAAVEESPSAKATERGQNLASMQVAGASGFELHLVTPSGRLRAVPRSDLEERYSWIYTLAEHT